MQVYDFNVTNLAPQEIGATGKYIKYLSGNAGGADATIKVQGGRNGEFSILTPGQALTFTKQWGSFTVAANAPGSAIIGKVVIGDGRMDDSTVQGTVQVVDGGKARTLLGQTFMANGGANAVAAQFAVSQLWNAPGNTNRLVVESVGLIVATVPLTAVVAIQNALIPAGGLITQWLSKKGGGPVGQGAIYGLSSAATAPGGGATMQLGGSANNVTMYKFNEPIVLPPGYGLTVWSLVANATMGGVFEGYEELNV